MTRVVFLVAVLALAGCASPSPSSGDLGDAPSPQVLDDTPSSVDRRDTCRGTGRPIADLLLQLTGDT